jgi:hypothetical protein
MPMDRRLATLALIVCVEAMAWACSTRTAPVPAPESGTPAPRPARPEPPPPPAESGAGECALIADPGEPIASVALGDRIDPTNAPHATNDSERLLFRQLYETLVRVDCKGRLHPELAASWRLDPDGRTWIVTLRENARFSDGTAVTAAAVRASWTRDGIGDELRPHVGRLVESIVAVDDRTVAIALRSPRVDAPVGLAHPDLGIARPAADSRWPLGTRFGRIVPAHDVPAGASAIAVERDHHAPLRFLVSRGDPRDLLDEGIDLLLTRDPAALEYAATLARFQSVPLAWGRTYVLLSRGRTRMSPALSGEARQALAADAVRGEARGATPPFWWERPADCELARAPAGSPPSLAPRIVYDARDAAARDLAERFVGLVRASDSGSTATLDALLPDDPGATYRSAAGLTGEALALARRRGHDAGYIVALDSRPLDPCRDLQVLMDGAPWLDPEAIVPLVETRLHAVVRRGRSGISADWDGGVLIGAPARLNKQ